MVTIMNCLPSLICIEQRDRETVSTFGFTLNSILSCVSRNNQIFRFEYLYNLSKFKYLYIPAELITS